MFCPRALLQRKIQTASFRIWTQITDSIFDLTLIHVFFFFNFSANSFNFVTISSLVTWNVTVCRWSAKQTIPLSVLARNQTKGLDSRSWTWPEVGKGTRVEELDKGTQRKAVGDGRRRVAVGQSTPDSRRDQSDEIGSSRSERRPVKMSQHSSWFVEFSLEIHASVSLQEMQSVTT